MLPMPNLDTARNTNYQEAKLLTRKLQQAGQTTLQPLKVVGSNPFYPFTALTFSQSVTTRCRYPTL
jgi:hypothetical protein